MLTYVWITANVKKSIFSSCIETKDKSRSHTYTFYAKKIFFYILTFDCVPYFYSFHYVQNKRQQINFSRCRKWITLYINQNWEINRHHQNILKFCYISAYLSPDYFFTCQNNLNKKPHKLHIITVFELSNRKTFKKPADKQCILRIFVHFVSSISLCTFLNAQKLTI